jgi:DNA-binding CsgD family transcriptional regulator/energy-coupling factor transporter ATP-binding protein EcfA2
VSLREAGATLVEREAQLRRLSGLLDATQREQGAIVVLCGVAGSGRTTLLHSFSALATSAEAQVLYATGSRAERALPLGIIDQLFRSAQLGPVATARVAGLLKDASLLATLHAQDPGVTEQAIASMLRQLCSEILDLASGRPVIIEVDDAHYIDVISLQCLLYLARRIKTAPVLIVLAERNRPGAIVSRELVHQPHSHQIRLPLLSRQGVAAVFAKRLGDTARSLIDDCWYISGGNPLLVHGLVQDQACTIAPSRGGLNVGEAFAEAVMSCMYRCDSTLLTTARKLAVLDGSAMPVALLDNGTISKAITELEATGLLNDGEFRHPGARAAVLEALTPDEQADLHLQAAQLLHENGASASAVAEHLSRAGSTQGDWCIGVLKSAGEQGLSSGNQFKALGWLRRAEQLSSDDQQRQSVRNLLTTAEWQVDPGVAVREMPRLLEELRAGLLTDPQVSSLAIQLMWAGKADEADEVVDWLLANRGVANPERFRAMAYAQSALWFLYPGRFAALRCRGVLAESWPPLLECIHGRLEAAMRHPGAAEDADGLIRVVTRQPDFPRRGQVTIANAVNVFVMAYHGWFERSIALCNQVLTSVDGPSPLRQAIFTVAKSWVTSRQGDFGAAARHARMGLSIMRTSSWGIALGFPIAILVRALVDMGNLGEAASLLAMAMPEGLFESPFGLFYLQARGRYKLAVGRLDSALEDFLQCGDLMMRWNMDLPAVIPWRTEAAAVYLRLGQSDRARQVAQEQLALAGKLGWARAVSLRSLATVSSPQDRITMLRECIALLENCDDRRERASAYADLSWAYFAAGQQDEAGTLAKQAEMIRQDYEIAPPSSDQRGWPDVPSHARRETQTRNCESSSREGIVALSDAERRVAELAARGRTNRQIASALFVTVSTVEQHLTRVYRKLGISRSDLSGWLETARYP